MGTDWHLEVASPIGSETAGCRHVVLATGGYITPREHSAIDGPRPSGVMTADFVVDALDRGWRPARRAIVVGDGRIASGVSARLRTVGVEVETTGGAAPGDGRAVTAVRGQPRLEAIEVGDVWHPADALILADRLQPANFLLRGLGLGDERPGIPAPVDADGALPMPGLWAAGTCVAPDVDHVRSLADGLAVAQALLATVERTTSASTRPPRRPRPTPDWSSPMSALADETVVVRVPLARIWEAFADVEVLAKVLPGCETLTETGDGAFRGVLATKLQFLTLRADVTATLADRQPPDALRLELDGKPRGLAGGFRAVIPIELADVTDGTRIHYTVDLTTSGRLATFGTPILRDSFRKQVATLIANLERVQGAPS
jgi:carbon monoxide dehydrogenase subunit G